MMKIVNSKVAEQLKNADEKITHFDIQNPLLKQALMTQNTITQLQYYNHLNSEQEKTCSHDAYVVLGTYPNISVRQIIEKEEDNEDKKEPDVVKLGQKVEAFCGRCLLCGKSKMFCENDLENPNIIDAREFPEQDSDKLNGYESKYLQVLSSFIEECLCSKNLDEILSNFEKDLKDFIVSKRSITKN